MYGLSYLQVATGDQLLEEKWAGGARGKRRY